MGQEGGADEVHAVAVHGLQGALPCVLEVVDRHLQRCRVPAAVLHRPVDAHPSGLGQLPLPPTTPGNFLVERRERRRRRDVGIEPRPQLVPKGFFLGGQCEIQATRIVTSTSKVNKTGRGWISNGRASSASSRAPPTTSSPASPESRPTRRGTRSPPRAGSASSFPRRLAVLA